MILVLWLGLSALFGHHGPHALYTNWLVAENRPTADHWISRDNYEFRKLPAATVIHAVRQCRVRSEATRDVQYSADDDMIAETLVPVLVDPDKFVILASNDNTEKRGPDSCTISVKAGTYRYKVSSDGQSMSVREGELTELWIRYASAEYEAE
jgi:hypothetical protein